MNKESNKQQSEQKNERPIFLSIFLFCRFLWNLTWEFCACCSSACWSCLVLLLKVKGRWKMKEQSSKDEKKKEEDFESTNNHHPCWSLLSLHLSYYRVINEKVINTQKWMNIEINLVASLSAFRSWWWIDFWGESMIYCLSNFIGSAKLTSVSRERSTKRLWVKCQSH